MRTRIEKHWVRVSKIVLRSECECERVCDRYGFLLKFILIEPFETYGLIKKNK